MTETFKTELIKNQITSEVDRIPELSNHIISLGGKRLRPILTIACAKMLNTENNHHIALAAAVELLHTATLVHDDVVDESELRRGNRSVNQVWTNSYSVLMGDFIYSKAFILMVKLGIPAVLDELAKATNDIARGEIIQLELFEKKQLIELKDLLKVSYLKTGRLFEASAKTGAMLACRSAEEIKTFGLLGKALGTAFQIQDDILENLFGNLPRVSFFKLCRMVHFAYAESYTGKFQKCGYVHHAHFLPLHTVSFD